MYTENVPLLKIIRSHEHTSRRTTVILELSELLCEPFCAEVGSPRCIVVYRVIRNEESQIRLDQIRSSL